MNHIHNEYKDQIFGFIEKERDRQENGIELIASENFVSNDVLKAMGSCMTNKYAEGLPNKRYYGGCEFVDEVEIIARETLCKLFGATWANVQPHSGAQANSAAMLGVLKPGDTILGFDLAHGGHLTHGSPVNFSGKLYRPVFYGVDEKTGRIDYNIMEATAMEHKPKLIIAGASSYSRDWDWATIRAIADKCGALLMADIAHPSGLIASKLLSDPLPHCHFVTSTTHKTLRGPRGGVIMMGNDYDNPFGLKTPKGKIRSMSSILDSAVFPGTQGGPLMHVIAAKAVAFSEALQDSYKDYCKQVIANAKALASYFMNKDYNVISGGTDNHMFLLDLRNKDVTGKVAEETLQKAEITVNKNMVPFDTKSPFITSGMRIGTAAMTTRGLKEEQMTMIGEWIHKVLTNIENEDKIKEVKAEVHELMQNYPLPY